MMPLPTPDEGARELRRLVGAVAVAVIAFAMGYLVNCPSFP
jgi:hypothetical protein